MIKEDVWDLSPVTLYKPPEMDFTQKIQNQIHSDININNVAKKYLEAFQKTIDSVSETKELHPELFIQD